MEQPCVIGSHILPLFGFIYFLSRNPLYSLQFERCKLYTIICPSTQNGQSSSVCTRGTMPSLQAIFEPMNQYAPLFPPFYKNGSVLYMTSCAMSSSFAIW